MFAGSSCGQDDGEDTRAIYTVTHLSEAMLSSAQAWHGLLHLHRQYGPDLNQTFDVIVAAYASSAQS